MAIDLTIIEKPLNFQNVQSINQAYKVVHLHLPAQANAAGSGAGAAVTTAVTLADLPASYMVFVTPNQKASANVTAKTSAGFNVVLNPILATETLSAGTFDCLVVYEI